MLWILLYGYCLGIYRSRRLERATWEDVSFRVICGDCHPHFTTINEFRRVHQDVGDRLYAQARIAEITDKKSRNGQLVFVKMITEFRNEAGDLVAEAILTGVERTYQEQGERRVDIALSVTDQDRMLSVQGWMTLVVPEEAEDNG